MRNLYIILFALLAVSGCKKETIELEEKASPMMVTNRAFFGATLYYLDENTSSFIPAPVLLAVDNRDTITLIKSVLSKLIEPVETENLVTPFPTETKVESIFMDSDNNVYVQLNYEAYTMNLAGATPEKQMLEAIIRTIEANFPYINGVQLIDRNGEVKQSRLDLRKTKSIDDL